MKIVFGIVIVFGLFMLIGTAGAIETGGITIAQGASRMAWVIPMTLVALGLLKKKEK